MDGIAMNRIALIVSTLAIVCSTLAAVGAWRASSRRPPHPTTFQDDARVDELERQVALLRRQMEAVRVGLAARTVVANRGGDAGAPGEVAANLATLSQRLAELEQQTQTARRMGMLPGQLSPAELGRATGTALDRHASVDQRVAALLLLRPVNGRADGRTPEVTAAMIELIQAPDTSSKHRSDIIRHLSRVDHPALKAPLVAAVSRDADPQTRREAVETLKSFYSDSEVRGLVTRLKESDPDPRVRFEAERRLAEWQAEQYKR